MRHPLFQHLNHILQLVLQIRTSMSLAIEALHCGVQHVLQRDNLLFLFLQSGFQGGDFVPQRFYKLLMLIVCQGVVIWVGHDGFLLLFGF